MRTDEDLSNVIKNDTRSTVSSKKSTKSLILISLMPFLCVITIISFGLLNNSDIIDMMKISIMTFLLTTVMIFFIRLQGDVINVKFSKRIIWTTYLLSLLLILLPNNPEIYSFWMIGGLLIAMLIDIKLGLLVCFNLTFILGISYSLRPETIIHFLIMGVLLILLASSLKEKTTVIYASIIILSSNITLSFIMNNFIFDSSINVNYLASFFSILVVLVTAFLLSNIYDRMLSKNYENAKKSVSCEDIDISTDNNNTKIIKTSYDILLSEKNELILKMKEYSAELYEHCMLIGDLSGRAAHAIGAKESLARAGGYYHELGRMNGKNYIEEGLKLAEEYRFPDELKNILKEHNIKYDKPTSVESAIVMISDNLASTIEYIDKTANKKFALDKIVDNIFRMRMDKGTFDDSGLSVRDFKLLKEFYQNEFKKKGEIKEDSDDISYGL